MGIVVQKFGGSSVADVAKLQAVAQRVAARKRAGDDVVVVVSAMGKTTDQLLALAREIDSTPPRRELDMLLSTGERVSMALLSMAIQKLGHDAISFTGSQSGIITNDRHFDARIIDVRPHRVEDELARGRIVIIAGYQGMSYKREITTLGRGGSDTTALAMAAALGARHAEIYSDVDGVYSADPRKVPDAQHLPEIGYDEMQEMAEAGAKVLHAKAVEFARSARIAIHARSTFDASGKETLVHDTAESGLTRAVVGQAGLARVRISGEGPAVLTRLRSLGAQMRDVRADASGVEALIVVPQTPNWEACRDQAAEVEEGLGSVSVVGSDPEAAQSVADVLSAQKVEATWSAHPLRVTAIVPEAKLDDVVSALHERLVSAIPSP